MFAFFVVGSVVGMNHFLKWAGLAGAGVGSTGCGLALLLAVAVCWMWLDDA